MKMTDNCQHLVFGELIFIYVCKGMYYIIAILSFIFNYKKVIYNFMCSLYNVHSSFFSFVKFSTKRLDFSSAYV